MIFENNMLTLGAIEVIGFLGFKTKRHAKKLFLYIFCFKSIIYI